MKVPEHPYDWTETHGKLYCGVKALRTVFCIEEIPSTLTVPPGTGFQLIAISGDGWKLVQKFQPKAFMPGGRIISFGERQDEARAHFEHVIDMLREFVWHAEN